MSDKDELKVIIGETVKAILSVSDNVEKIILFGSKARGDSKPDSDIDVLVVLDIPEEQLSMMKREMRNLASDIGLEHDELISLVIVTKEYFESMGNTLFYQNVAKDGIIMYEPKNSV